MKRLVLFASLCVAMCACNDNAFINEPIQESETMLSRSGEITSTENYTVTPEMVCKYLNIARKGKPVNILTPVVENGDTLAYVAQYADTLGWDLISGDRRLDPVLANSETGILNLSDTINPAVGAVKGMIGIVKETKEKNDTLKNNIWKFLEPKEVKTINRPQARGWGFGKWIAQDTLFEDNTYTSNRIISTHWGQDNGYNSSMPLIGDANAVVGCIPIAVGQVIAQYRKNNPRDIEIPRTAIPYGSSLLYYDYSIENWNYITNTTIVNKSAVAAYLAFISDDMDLDYGIESTTGDKNDVVSALNNYKLSYSIANNYDYSIIYSNLKASKPIIIFSRIKDTERSHAFIIDGYSEHETKLSVNWVWDPTYELQEGEDAQLPPANEDKEGYWEEIDNSKSVSFAMNWGWEGYGDNTYYLAYNFKHGVYNIYYNPLWTVGGNTMNNVTKMFYNITEATE